MIVREREDIIGMGSAYVNKMQKALELMNIKLKNVLSQIHGSSGAKMIEAIINGERDSEKLLALCYSTVVTTKSEAIKKALEGNYNPSWIFLLSANYKMWRQHNEHLHEIDKKIESLLEEIMIDRPGITCTTKAKPIRHHKPEIRNLHQKMVNIYGTNVSSLSGITDYSALRLLSETGFDLGRFPTAKHFISWCQLSPRNSQSGTINRRLRMKAKSKAGQIFREAAQSLLQSKKTAIGAFMRKIRSKKGASIAIKAGARKIAMAYYNIITKGQEYVERGINQYEAKIREREIRLLSKLAIKYNVSLLNSQ